MAVRIRRHDELSGSCLPTNRDALTSDVLSQSTSKKATTEISNGYNPRVGF